jgi:hypothetical protein
VKVKNQELQKLFDWMGDTIESNIQEINALKHKVNQLENTSKEVDPVDVANKVHE